ncbi:hypothetical protein BDV95DRAFT_589776 [Massariosphaeria phaeospora]|uniref:Integral membrane protein n=1 Tax=Massariosphaeria phaeospora TaxID=100035 RepID=A0A7C8MFS3_9PLEO|nr:hypothetical protein BDV95DRAFT_589776 [Massariosphaeria phaeospora]
MFEHFAYRHLPPLLLAAVITVGGARPYTHGCEHALLEFGFPKAIAVNKAAWPVIKTGSARVTTIGLALLGMYAGGHLQAMDILLAALGWTAVIDGIVCAKEGSPGSARFRVLATVPVAVWGALGMTTGKFF